MTPGIKKILEELFLCWLWFAGWALLTYLTVVFNYFIVVYLIYPLKIFSIYKLYFLASHAHIYISCATLLFWLLLLTEFISLEEGSFQKKYIKFMAAYYAVFFTLVSFSTL